MNAIAVAKQTFGINISDDVLFMCACMWVCMRVCKMSSKAIDKM